MNTEVLLARQPIYDRNHKLYGFELLYRGIAREHETQTQQTMATVEVLSNICTNSLEDNLNLGLPMFINVDETFIASDEYFPAPSQHLILEILEHVPPKPDILQKLSKFRRQGFRFALDDYVFEPGREVFFPLVSVIKVDISPFDMKTLAQHIEPLKATKCTLLAEKVENTDMMAACMEMGFDLFQGYYLEQPRLISGQKIDASKQLVLRLVSELSREEVSVDEVVALLALDPRLTYKILLLVNSPVYQFVREIKSIKEAVVALGLEAVKRWALILSLVLNSDQPNELFRILLVRAKTMELIAQANKEEEPNSFFLLGILSGIDAILHSELHTLVERLSLPDEIKSALITRQNSPGKLLNHVIGIERFDASVLESLSNQQAYLYNSCYRRAIHWADEVINSL